MPSSRDIRHGGWPGQSAMTGAVLVMAGLMLACNPNHMGSLTKRLSIATGGTGGVYYPYGGGIAKVISDHVEGVEATAEVTAGTVDNLKFIANRSADLAFGLADSIDDAVNGRGAFAEFARIPLRALAVLYDNHNHVVTLARKEIATIADLKDKVISTGAPGSGTEISAFRILEAAGIDPERDIRKQRLGAAQSVAALKDGKIDAFFWSGGIPTGSVLDLAATPGRTIVLVPNTEVLATLQERYGAFVYHASTIPKSIYPGMEENVATVAVSNVLVVHESMDAELAYWITRALFEAHDELAAIHPMATALTLEAAVQGSPISFHDGAVRYYREEGTWQNSP